MTLLDGRPALEAFAEAAGETPDTFRFEDFMEYMPGVMVDGEPVIRGGSRIFEDGSLQFFITIKEGRRLTVMRAGDIVGCSCEVLAAKKAKLVSISALLAFDCVYRNMILRPKNEIVEYLS
ncbi:MAG: FIST C-terminal domain-containing protein [Planctomycetota bacterium]|jgi:hypothetical protein|nr:FIST C-terminal domain-containing protein [Planctomycetota bacterium]